MGTVGFHSIIIQQPVLMLPSPDISLLSVCICNVTHVVDIITDFVAHLVLNHNISAACVKRHLIVPISDANNLSLMLHAPKQMQTPTLLVP